MAFGEVGTSLSKIKANSLNLAGTFGFSGTVSGLADETPLVLIQESSISAGTATVSFTSGIDSTYKEYLFIYNNIHPENNNVHFTFNMSTDGGSNYNVTKTTTSFQAYHRENDEASPAVAYAATHDLAQSTDYKKLFVGVGNDNDQNGCGILTLFNPSSTTHVKHFIAVSNGTENNDYQTQWLTAGYGNTTSAIDAIQFKMSDGDMDDGTIQLFGVV